MSRPSLPQVEKHIRRCAQDTSNIIFLAHAQQRMSERDINHAMVVETLRMGMLAREPEPDIRTGALRYRMERYVAGINVAVIVELEYPDPTLTVITVVEVRRN